MVWNDWTERWEFLHFTKSKMFTFKEAFQSLKSMVIEGGKVIVRTSLNKKRKQAIYKTYRQHVNKLAIKHTNNMWKTKQNTRNEQRQHVHRKQIISKQVGESASAAKADVSEEEENEKIGRGGGR